MTQAARRSTMLTHWLVMVLNRNVTCHLQQCKCPDQDLWAPLYALKGLQVVCVKWMVRQTEGRLNHQKILKRTGILLPTLTMTLRLISACQIIALACTILRTATVSAYRVVPRERTLVMHIFADTDPEYLLNLKFFVQYGILSKDSAEFIIIVQTNTSDVVRCNFAPLQVLLDQNLTSDNDPWLVCKVARAPRQRQIRAA